jgi:hypothetical protein
MRVHPVPVKRTPLFLHFTYSLCLHAAALSLLITLPVFGGGGAPPGGEYVVTLTSPAGQSSPGDTLEKTSRQPAGEPGVDESADIIPVEKDAGTGGVDYAGRSDVAEDVRLPNVADAAKVQTARTPVADTVPIPSNITAPSAGSPELTATVKPFFADVPSESVAAGNARGAVKADALYQAKTEPLGGTKTSAAVIPTQLTAPPVQEKPPTEPDVPEALPEPESELVAAIPPMFIPAKAVISVEPDRKLPPAETSPPVPDRKVVSSKTAAEARGKRDVSSSPDAIGTSPATRGKDAVGQTHPTGKSAGSASAQKSGQGGSRGPGAGALASGSGTSSKKSGTGESAKSGGPPGGRRNGGVGTGNVAGTPRGSGKGYELSTPSLSREFGLLRGIGGAFSGPILARREGPSGSEIPEKGERKGTEEMPAVAIRVPEELLVQDIKIEVAAEKRALSDISMGLTIRAHPADRKKHTGDAERKIEMAEIAIGRGDPGASATKTLTVKIAEKGVYIFSLTNTGNASSVAVVFRLHARSEKERIKEYKSLPLTPASVMRFKFLMPEAIFWDDTERFSGSIEDSHSVTKFRYETGLLWKEEKE